MTSPLTSYKTGIWQMSPDLPTQACLSAFLPHSRGLLAEEGQGEVRGSWMVEVAWAEVPCAWCWVKMLGSWLRRPFLTIQLPASPFPAIASHFHAPSIPHPSHPSLVGMAKWAEQQPDGPRLDDEA